MTKEMVDAFLVPRSDAHQGEEVTPANERLAVLTVFVLWFNSETILPIINAAFGSQLLVFD